MPQASDELRAQFDDDNIAWMVLQTNYAEHRFLIYPKVLGYEGTKKENDAIDYLCSEWDWAYEAKYAESEEFKLEHIRKMRVVHAIWLAAHIEVIGDIDAVMKRAALLLGQDLTDPKRLFRGFNDDYLDRAWHSRPTNWLPGDSIAFLEANKA
jgi:hypothetical protein